MIEFMFYILYYIYENFVFIIIILDLTIFKNKKLLQYLV